jgi:hypothetical protein
MHIASYINQHSLIKVFDHTVLYTRFYNYSVTQNNRINFTLEVVFHSMSKFLLDTLGLPEIKFFYIYVACDLFRQLLLGFCIEVVFLSNKQN